MGQACQRRASVETSRAGPSASSASSAAVVVEAPSAPPVAAPASASPTPAVAPEAATRAEVARSGAASSQGPTGAAPTEPDDAAEPARAETAAAGSSAAPLALAERLRRCGNDLFKQKEYDAAVAAYDRALVMQPDHGVCWLNRSIAYRQLSQWEAAERDAARAIELQPDSEKAHYSRAVALQQMGKLKEAMESCIAGLTIQQENKALVDLQKSLLLDHKALREGRPLPSQKGKKPPQSGQPEQEEKAAKLAQHRPTVEVPEKKKYDVDYSKWSHIVDSDDEGDEMESRGVLGLDKDLKEWSGDSPSMAERYTFFDEVMSMCRSQVAREADEIGNARTRVALRPGVKLPADYKQDVGIISVKQLAKYSCSNDRMLVSVYGDIYDVSGHPDLYGYGPKSFHAGRDITWGVVTGKETAANCNRFYDVFKLDEDHLKRYLQIICRRLIAMEEDFGEPVGRLDKFMAERDLPPPPNGEIEECNQQ